MPKTYVEDYEEVTGLTRDEAEADVVTKVVAAPETAPVAPPAQAEVA